MRISIAIILLATSLSLQSCSQQEDASPPLPFALTEEAMGRYCGMNVLEHSGPKGQIILENVPEAIWFSSARDTLAFTMLPEEPRDIAAIYVSDMSKAASWEEPGAENWVDAREAVFVIDSARRSGMGTEEAVPFSKDADARAFAKLHGGRVVRFNDVPQDYVLGSGTSMPDAAPGSTRETEATEVDHHG